MSVTDEREAIIPTEFWVTVVGIETRQRMVLTGFRFVPGDIEPEQALDWVNANVPKHLIVNLAWSHEATFAYPSLSVRLGRRDVTDFAIAEVAIEQGITAIYLAAKKRGIIQKEAS